MVKSFAFLTFLSLVIFYSVPAIADEHNHHNNYYTIGVTTIDAIGVNVCPSEKVAKLVAKGSIKNLKKGKAIFKSLGCGYKTFRFTPVRKIGKRYIARGALMWQIAEVIDESSPKKQHRIILTILEIKNAK